VADVGATAAAEHLKVRMAAKQLSVLIRQLQGIAVVELLCFVELSVTGAGGVCPQEAETLDRRWVSIECVSEWSGCAQLIPKYNAARPVAASTSTIAS
jgi:hypothetical protein